MRHDTSLVWQDTALLRGHIFRKVLPLTLQQGQESSKTLEIP